MPVFAAASRLQMLQCGNLRALFVCEKAFTGTKLRFIIIPSSVEEIDDSCFGECN